MTNRFKLVALADHFWDLAVDYQDVPGWLDVGNKMWEFVKEQTKDIV